MTVFAGPIFNKAQVINGLLTPLSFWKILVYEKDGQLSALGFIMSQQPYLEEKLLTKKVVLDNKEMLLVEKELVEPSLKSLISSVYS